MSSPSNPQPETGAMERPTIHKEGSTFVVEWYQGGVKAMCRNVREHSDSLTSEITWYVNDGSRWNLLFRSSFNLTAPQSRTTLTKLLEARAGFPFRWPSAIDQLCIVVPDMWRAGEPFLLLQDVEIEAQPRFLIEGLLPEDDVAVLYGNGEAGKSLLAMGMAVAVASGQPFAGRWKVANPGPVLYLDWETHKGDQSRRLRRLMAEVPLPEGLDKLPLWYRRMNGALADQVEGLAEFVDRQGIRFVIGDSLGFAVADDINEAGMAIRVMDAARSLGTTFVFTAHITKDDTKRSRGDGGKAASIFGSKFFELGARMTWEVRSTDPDDATKRILMTNRKANNIRHQEPRGFEATFAPSYGPIRFSDMSITDDPAGPASIAHRVGKLLTRGALTVPQIAEATKATEDSLRVVLKRMESRGEVRLVEGRPQRWGLAAPEFAGRAVPLAAPDAPAVAGDAAEEASEPPAAPGEAQEGGAVAVAEAVEECVLCGKPRTRYTAPPDMFPICDNHAEDL